MILLIKSKRIHQRRIFQKIHIDASKPSDRPQTGAEFHWEWEPSHASKNCRPSVKNERARAGLLTDRRHSDLQPPSVGRGWAVESSGMVTKDNKKFAGSAGIRESTRRWSITRRSFVYEPQRVIEATLEVVRDTGFEPATSCV